MKHLSVLFLAMGFVVSVCYAQKISIECHHTKLSAILHLIDSLQSDVKLHYEEAELEDYWWREFSVNEMSAKRAVRKACDYFPISISQEGHNIYIVNNRKSDFCYQGRVLNEDNMAVGQATAQLLSPFTGEEYSRADIVEDGNFNIPCSHNPVLMKISAPNYEEKTIICRQESVGSIHLYDELPAEPSKKKPFYSAEPIVGTKIEVSEPGTLSDLLTKEQSDTCSALIINGTLNSDDIRHLRHMAGYKEENYGTGRLQKLDMENVRFVDDKRSYMTLDAAEENLLSYTEAEHRYGGIQEDMTLRIAPVTYHTELLNERNQWYRGTTTVEDKSFWKRNNEMSIAYFKPKHILNSDPDLGTNGAIFADDRTAAYAKYTGNKVSGKDFKKLKHYNLTKAKGHQISFVEGKTLWKAYSKKNYISMDMFYKCPYMNEVVIPNGIETDRSIKVKRQRIKYREASY